MALIGANELKRKMLIVVDGQPFTVMEVFFASPSARGASTMVRTKMRHLITNAVLEKTFKTSEKFEEADVVLTPASYLYSDAENYHFMDEANYDQFSLTAEQLGDDRLYLVRRGSIRAELPFPRGHAEREFAAARVRDVFSASEPSLSSVRPHEIAQILLVARWFRLRPTELANTVPPEEFGRATRSA